MRYGFFERVGFVPADNFIRVFAGPVGNAYGTPDIYDAGVGGFHDYGKLDEPFHPAYAGVQERQLLPRRFVIAVFR
jgi:hypothetical protein